MTLLRHFPVFLICVFSLLSLSISLEVYQCVGIFKEPVFVFTDFLYCTLFSISLSSSLKLCFSSAYGFETFPLFSDFNIQCYQFHCKNQFHCNFTSCTVSTNVLKFKYLALSSLVSVKYSFTFSWNYLWTLDLFRSVLFNFQS